MEKLHNFFRRFSELFRTLYMIVVAGLLIVAVITYARFFSESFGEFSLYGRGRTCKIDVSHPLSLAVVSLEEHKLELFFYRSYVLSNFSQVTIKVRDRCLNMTVVIVKRRAVVGEIFGFGIDLSEHNVECLEIYGFVGPEQVLRIVWPFDC